MIKHSWTSQALKRCNCNLPLSLVNPPKSASFAGQLLTVLLLSTVLFSGSRTNAQVNVVTSHNDIGRTGQNLNETVLTPANVNSTQFGKLFSQSVKGPVYAQPLYLSNVAIPGKGTHNVVYVTTNADVVYAFDADSNGGIDANPLWKTTLLTGSTFQPQYRSLGTPVIDPASNTIYVISTENNGTVLEDWLYALDVTTGAAKFGGPVQIQASVPGTGVGSSAGVLTFNPDYQVQRPGLLLLNGVLYIAFGSVGDSGPWHGWIFSYKGATLAQINVYCTSPNGSGAGIWMGGTGLVAEVPNPAKPYGRMFLATGNGSFSAAAPYSTSMSYGMSVLDFDLTGGVMTVQDSFTPFNWSALNSQDGDLGSGGPVLLPAQTLASGQVLDPLVQVGKTGAIYILNRNGLGGMSDANTEIVQQVQTPESGKQNWGAGIWGSPAYWNGNLYFGGTNPGASTSLTAYSFAKGVLSATPTSQTVEGFTYPGPTPAISSNGNTNPALAKAILWVLQTGAYASGGPDILLAYDATNLENLFYSSNADLARDNPGAAVEYTIPTVANGKVYVGATSVLDVYGLFADAQTTPLPVISPGSSSFTGSATVTISDSIAGSTIYYTTNGSTPTASSAVYTGPIKVTESETMTAIAGATGYLQSGPVSAIFSSTANAANPVLSLAPGTYNGPQTLTISDSSKDAVIYYTVDGSTPTTASPVYGKPITVSVSETVQAFATAPSLLASAQVGASYDIDPVYTFSFPDGFTDAQGRMQFNGSTDLDDFRLQLTNGGTFEAGSAFYATPVNIQSFTTDFTFQLSNPVADGMTFTIQNNSAGALGGEGGKLGYAGIGKSVAIKFDLYNNAGEGPNSTGLYTDGALPEVPAINLTGTGIDLHSGDQMVAHITYDGINLNLTITDEVTLATWSHAFAIDIPATVGGNTAYVGFTGGAGGSSSSQKITTWTYLVGPPPVPSYPTGFDSAGLTLNGSSAFSGTSLQLTNGGAKEISSAYYKTPLDIESFSSTFDFMITDATADGFTFVMQNGTTGAMGTGSGGLGYATMPNSVAIKFDFYNNAGEGPESTGVYVNGAMPTVPSLSLQGGAGLNIVSGHVIQVAISYNGTTLTWKLTDLDALQNPSMSESQVINIPHTIGSNTAYVGFTAASGDGTAIQAILDWTFTDI
jgi:hypothetical protein